MLLYKGFLMNSAKNITKLRIKLGYTQASLAFELEVSQVTISRYEKGLREPSVETANKLLNLARKKGFNLHLEDIFYENIDKKLK